MLALSDTRAEAASRRQVRHDVRQATHDQAFVLLFQPRVSLRCGALRGVQAQIRWPRRRSGLTQAGAFLPLLQQCGVAEDVAAWTLLAACRAALSWAEAPVWVSVPAWTLHEGRLLSLVGEALAQSGLPAERLGVEICAEAADAAGGDDCLLALGALRDHGVAVALDEFGASTACLQTLRRLPLTALKLDRCLVRDLPDDRDAACLATAALGLAHALGIEVVAGGVETEAQRNWLRRVGCDQAQGSLLGRALGEAEFVAGLERVGRT